MTTTTNTNTNTIDLIAAKKAVMKAARHLNPSRMAWVANSWTSGIDWRGCTKGHIAESLTTRSYARFRNPEPITESGLADLCYRMRMQADSNGETGLIPEDADRINAKVAALRAKAAKLESRLALHKSGKRTNFKVEYDYNGYVRTANRLESAIKKVTQ
jgi:hypothetical protein